MISEAVLEESLCLRATDTSLPPERINFSRLLASGQLNICSAETPDEEALYVELASQLDDGEALSRSAYQETLAWQPMIVRLHALRGRGGAWVYSELLKFFKRALI